MSLPIPDSRVFSLKFHSETHRSKSDKGTEKLAAETSTPGNHQASFPFLLLPTEIQMMILRHALPTFVGRQPDGLFVDRIGHDGDEFEKVDGWASGELEKNDDDDVDYEDSDQEDINNREIYEDSEYETEDDDEDNHHNESQEFHNHGEDQFSDESTSDHDEEDEDQEDEDREDWEDAEDDDEEFNLALLNRPCDLKEDDGTREDNGTPREKYNLAILRVCRKFYQVGWHILERETCACVFVNDNIQFCQNKRCLSGDCPCLGLSSATTQSKSKPHAEATIEICRIHRTYPGKETGDPECQFCLLNHEEDDHIPLDILGRFRHIRVYIKARNPSDPRGLIEALQLLTSTLKTRHQQPLNVKNDDCPDSAAVPLCTLDIHPIIDEQPETCCIVARSLFGRYHDMIFQMQGQLRGIPSVTISAGSREYLKKIGTRNHFPLLLDFALLELPQYCNKELLEPIFEQAERDMMGDGDEWTVEFSENYYYYWNHRGNRQEEVEGTTRYVSVV